MRRAVEYDSLERVAVNFLEFEEELDGVVGRVDPLDDVHLEAVGAVLVLGDALVDSLEAEEAIEVTEMHLVVVYHVTADPQLIIAFPRKDH